MNVGKNIRRLRESAGITQDELARRLEISRGMNARIERGSRDPSLQMLEDIAKEFNVPATKLLE